MKVRDIDQCKRTAAELIRPDGRNLNQELVHAGLGVVVSAVRAPRHGAAGSGARGSERQARVVERPEAGGSLGVEESGRRGSQAVGTRRGGGGLLGYCARLCQIMCQSRE